MRQTDHTCGCKALITLILDTRVGSIIEGLRESLDRLQLDYVDVVFAHRPDPTGKSIIVLALLVAHGSIVPMEETVRAFNYLINSGQALYWGM